MIRSFFTHHKALSTLIGITGIFMLVALLLLGIRYGKLSSSIVLHFDSFHGVDVMGARVSLWWIWFLGLVMCLVNGGLAYEMYYRERFLSYLFLGANTLVSLFTLIIVGVITSIN